MRFEAVHRLCDPCRGPRLALLASARGPGNAGLLRRLCGGHFWPAEAEAIGRAAGQARAGMRGVTAWGAGRTRTDRKRTGEAERSQFSSNRERRLG